MIAVVARLHLSQLFNRIKLVVTNPKLCWDTIASESATPRDLIGSLLLPLLLLGAACTILGLQVFGVHITYLGTWHPPLFEQIVDRLVRVVATIGTVFLCSMALKNLATNLGGRNDMNRAFSLLAHSMIPAALSSIFAVIPLLGRGSFLFLAVFSIYVLYQGCSKMLDIPDNQRITFVVSAVAVMILFSTVFAWLSWFVWSSTPPGTLVM